MIHRAQQALDRQLPQYDDIEKAPNWDFALFQSMGEDNAEADASSDKVQGRVEGAHKAAENATIFSTVIGSHYVCHMHTTTPEPLPMATQCGTRKTF